MLLFFNKGGMNYTWYFWYFLFNANTIIFFRKNLKKFDSKEYNEMLNM